MTIQKKTFNPEMTLEEVIFTAGGAFSSCWETLEGAGVFDSTRAKDIGDELLRWLEDNTTMLIPENGKGERIVHQCIHEGEPFFVFRARDIFSIMIVRHYAKLVEEYGPLDLDFQESILHFIDTMHDWHKTHPTKVRYPD